MIRRISLFAIVCLLATSAFATTFVVPSDKHLVNRAGAIVVGKAVTSYTQLSERGAIETVTTIDVEEVLKGRLTQKSIKVHAPGGKYGDVFEVVPASPRFRDAERVILLVRQTKSGRWVVSELALGKFTLAKDRTGRAVALRQEEEIHGWTVDGAPHAERRRDAAKFIDFIRAVASGKEVDEEAHFLAAEDETQDRDSGERVGSQAHNNSFTASSYLFDANIRWNTFPRTFTHTNTLAGAPNGGADAITAALGLWTNDAGSGVQLQHGGLDATKTQGVLGNADGANTVKWEVDFTELGAGPYVCSSGGVLGLGNIRSGGQHTGPDGTTFLTATEGDVDMNVGLANCSSLFNSTIFVNALTHEIGHTLGFRHSDQTRAGDAACPGGTLECSDSAVMRSSIPGNIAAALQPYDMNAVHAVYPNVTVTAPAAPTGLTATATGSTNVTILWTASTGATNYRVFRRTSGGSYAEIGTTVSNSFGDTTGTGLAAGNAYQYVVRASNDGGESADSNSDFTVTMAFTDLMAPGVVIRSVHFTELQNAVNALRALGGLGTFSFAAPAPGSTVSIRKTHMDGLRTALNEARVQLGASALTLTDAAIVAGATGVKATHVTELRNGVF